MSNPTTKNGGSPVPPTFHIDIQLPPDGTLDYRGNITDPLVFYGMLKLAEKAFDQMMAKRAAESAMRALAAPAPRPAIIRPT